MRYWQHRHFGHSILRYRLFPIFFLTLAESQVPFEVITLERLMLSRACLLSLGFINNNLIASFGDFASF